MAQRDISSNPQASDPSDMQSVAFVSLGCPKNLVDSEKMLGLLAADGIAPVSWDPQADPRWDDAQGTEGRSSSDDSAGPEGFNQADAVVINTCGFLEAAKEESLAVIKEAVEAKRRGAVKRVIVAGCLVQRHRAKILEWAPGVDAMIGVFDRDHIIEAVRGTGPMRDGLDGDQPRYWIAANGLQAAKERNLKTVGLTVQGQDGKGVGYFEDDSARLRLTPRHYAYLRISEGCNQNCAFCTIPSIRGKMRSKPLDSIGAEARELVLDGAFELNLIGQDTTSYGDDIGTGVASGAGLPKLLRAVSDAVADAAGAGWVRLMYAYPSNFSDEIIDAFAQCCADGHLVPYIDMPLQHASERMLKHMRRNVTAEHQERLLEKLRDRIPGIAIRTTLISGFPGETHEDHQRLLEFVEEFSFDAVGVFEYSPEPGTVAGRMETDEALAVPAQLKTERKSQIMELQQRIAFEQAAYLAEQFDPQAPLESGCRFDVLIDRRTSTTGLLTPQVAENGRLYQGRTYFQAPQVDAVTYVQAQEQLAPGELVPCVVVASDGYDLIARPLNELEKRTSLPILS